MPSATTPLRPQCKIPQIDMILESIRYDIHAIHSQVPKTEFEEKKNDVLEREPFVTCGDCERKHHQVCVLHHQNIWKKG